MSGFDARDESTFCYWQDPDGWYLWIPGCWLAGLSKHTVTEHADGTITVEPSIRTTGYPAGEPVTRHGHLVGGTWTDC